MDALHRDRPRLENLSRLAFDRVRTLCDPLVASAKRVEFYRRVIGDFRRRSPAVTSEKLLRLPNAVASALLPCISHMTAALLRLDQPSDSPGTRLDEICEKICAGQSQPARVLLYGAGKHTARLLSERHRWERHGHRVIGLIDDHPRFILSPTFLGLPVRSLADVQRDAAAGVAVPPVILSTDTHEQQFWIQTQGLRDRGVRVATLYGLPSSTTSGVSNSSRSASRKAVW
jgi:hypothetical protein